MRINLLLDSGAPVECVQRGTGEQNALGSEYRSAVFYHCNTPKFDETLRIAIPTEAGRLERCHVLLTMFHCSTDRAKTKPFAFGFLPLTEDKGVVIKDGEHFVPTYKPLSGLETGPIVPAYLKPGGAKLSHRHVRSGVSKEEESFVLRTELCSTKRTQNVDLHHLLKWRELEDAAVVASLKAIPYSMAEVEIVKFLREIFDVLVALFVRSHTGDGMGGAAAVKAARAASAQSGRGGAAGGMAAKADEMQLLVFDLFVHVLSVITRRFKGFTPMLDAYIEEIFSGPTLSGVLVACVNHHIASLATDASARTVSAQSRRTLTNAMGCFHFILKFIIISREQALAELDEDGGASALHAPPLMSDAQFKSELRGMLAFVNGLLQRTDPPWIKVLHGKVIKTFPPVFRDLQDVFGVGQEMGALVRDFLEHLPMFGGGQGGQHGRGDSSSVASHSAGGGGAHHAQQQASSTLNTDKLLLLRSLVASDLFVYVGCSLATSPFSSSTHSLTHSLTPPLYLFPTPSSARCNTPGTPRRRRR